MTEKKLIAKAARRLRRMLPLSLPESVRLVRLVRQGRGSVAADWIRSQSTPICRGEDYECSSGHRVPGELTVSLRGKPVTLTGSCSGGYYVPAIVEAI